MMIGKQILFTDNIMKNKRAVSLQKVYELMNAHAVVGASNQFRSEFESVKDVIFDLLIRIDKGEQIDDVDKLVEDRIQLLLPIIKKEKLDEHLQLALKIEAENYNPWEHIKPFKSEK